MLFSSTGKIRRAALHCLSSCIDPVCTFTIRFKRIIGIVRYMIIILEHDMQVACATNDSDGAQHAAHRTAHALRTQLRYQGMESTALSRIERMHALHAHAELPEPVLHALRMLPPAACMMLAQHGGLAPHEAALTRNDNLLRAAVAWVLHRDNGKLTASYAYDYMPFSTLQLTQPRHRSPAYRKWMRNVASTSLSGMQLIPIPEQLLET